ncbi:MAG TPA: CRTAC1 family protein [Thermoanaerobaculia bacterium]|nr:CRTAC1 family protein [Thermoanaerobaculia bacterium]
MRLVLIAAVILAVILAVMAAAGAQPAPKKAPAPAKAPANAQAGGVRFTDVTAAAGIRFVHNSGRAGKKLLPETLGSGGAFLDFDGDGRLDVFLVNSRDWKPRGGKKSLPALYRNQGDGTFADVTRGSGLDVELYGMGVAVADYDNDGDPDLYLTALEGDRLFRNEGPVGGKARFRDVTAAAGIRNASFGTSAAWLDYDRDGRSDLLVANYVQWSEDKDLWCSLDGATKSYCTPESYTGTSSKLYRNLGGGKFADVSRQARVDDPTGKALGVAVLDYDVDGWPDLFVANDTQPNKLYRNLKNGTFAEEGLEAGVAFGEDGVARGAMGVDAADYDRSGRPHLLVGNFSNEMLALYHNEGNGVFLDDAPASAVGRASLLTLTFGAFFFDYDLDGHLDIFAANGHIEEEINRVQPRVQFKQPPLLFRNLQKGKFEPVTAAVGPDLNRPRVARGAAYGDYDGDGDLDLLVTTNHGPAHLFRNDRPAGGARNHWLRVRTVGTKSNRDGLGAVVRVASASGKQWQMVRSGSSYCSQSELVLTFGLGRDTRANVEIEWPSGLKQRLANVAADQLLAVEEGLPAKPAKAATPVRPAP